MSKTYYTTANGQDYYCVDCGRKKSNIKHENYCPCKDKREYIEPKYIQAKEGDAVVFKVPAGNLLCGRVRRRHNIGGDNYQYYIVCVDLKFKTIAYPAYSADIIQKLNY